MNEVVTRIEPKPPWQIINFTELREYRDLKRRLSREKGKRVKGGRGGEFFSQKRKDYMASLFSKMSAFSRRKNLPLLVANLSMGTNR